jgi:hypothetical protein
LGGVLVALTADGWPARVAAKISRPDQHARCGVRVSLIIRTWPQRSHSIRMNQLGNAANGSLIASVPVGSLSSP